MILQVNPSQDGKAPIEGRPDHRVAGREAVTDAIDDEGDDFLVRAGAHTAATLMLGESGDLHGVQKMLGHQQVALTADLYAHAKAERLRPLADGLGKLIRGS